MKILCGLLFALCGVVLGSLLLATVSYIIAGSAGMSDFEGGRAMFAGFIMGPVGALVGLIAGCLVASWLNRHYPVRQNIVVAIATSGFTALIAYLTFALG